MNQYTEVASDSAFDILSYTQVGNLANFDGWNYVYDAHNRLIEANDPSTTVVLSYDAIGRLTHTGSLLQAHQYDAYGNPKHSSRARFRYTGQILIPGTELYYYKARVYHPKLGRFMQTDPIGYQDGMNWYAYVGNDPLNLVDSTGRSSEEANVWAKMFGSSSADHATSKIDDSIESGREAITNSTSPENLSATSNALAGATVVALLAGHPEVAALTGTGSFLAQVGASIQSDDPVVGLATEAALQLTGMKLVGTVAKIANGALDSGPAVRNGIDATSDGTQTVIKNEIREEINDEQ
ncbi:RHS repeat-associated core domain-containing protein [Pseudidiomarina salilacus]|uniref:RHS repeat-associated core domain-containing protein n=1 Tax=Pseudidiomarina salilacus TaxID=3384452 RepID=UPI003984BCD8